jgi:hypothetical protein
LFIKGSSAGLAVISTVAPSEYSDQALRSPCSKSINATGSKSGKTSGN